MSYYSEKLEQFDLLDRYWELASWDGRDLAVSVAEPEVLAGEYAGMRTEKALVTFRGVRMEEVFTFEGETKFPMTGEEGIGQLAMGKLFVFSYYPHTGRCEFCGLGAEKPLVMIFGFDAAAVQWEESPEDATARGPVGELIRK